MLRLVSDHIEENLKADLNCSQCQLNVASFYTSGEQYKDSKKRELANIRQISLL